MILIEDKGKITFSHNGEPMTAAQGFAHLNEIYGNESIEVKRIIDGLKEKYFSDMVRKH